VIDAGTAEQSVRSTVPEITMSLELGLEGIQSTTKALDVLNAAQALSNAGGASSTILQMLRSAEAGLVDGPDAQAGAIAWDRLVLLLLQRGDMTEAETLLRQRGYQRRLSRAVLCQQAPPFEGNLEPCEPLASAIAVVDAALPLPLFSALQAALSPGAPFWSEHGYDHPETSFFSFVEPLAPASERSRDGMQRSTLIGAVVRHVAAIAASRLPAASLASTAEWWAHWRPHRAGAPLHFDSASADVAAGGDEVDGMSTPLVSTVLYLSGDGVGGRTLVTDQRWASCELATTGVLISPSENRLLLFEGDLLHGVVPAAEPQTRSGESAVRTTLMVALWRRMSQAPCAQPPPRDGAPEGPEAGPPAGLTGGMALPGTLPLLPPHGTPPAGLTGGMALPDCCSGWSWPRQLAADSGEPEGGEVGGAGGGETSSGEGEGGEVSGGDLGGETGSGEVVAPVTWIRPVWERVGPAPDAREAVGLRPVSDSVSGKRVRSGTGPRDEEHSAAAVGGGNRLPSHSACFQGITTWRRLDAPTWLPEPRT
jgi:hypothetical protein